MVSTRTTISVPAELKRRMDKAKGVNWSALACQAFETKLAEIVAKKEKKSMAAVILRLRESKRRGESRAVTTGRKAGESWAMYRAEVEELERLQSLWDSTPDHERNGLFDSAAGGASCAFSAAENLFFVMNPGDKGSRAAAREFWESEGGDENDSAFLEGFVTGAVEIWDGIKEEI